MIQEYLNTLGVDSTIGIQFIIFVVFYAWMRWVFFPPFLRLLAAREARTGALRGQTEDLAKAAAAKEAELQNELGRVKREAAQARDKVMAEASQAAHQLVDKSRKESKKRIEQARGKTTEALAVEAAGLKSESGSLADQLVKRLTSEGVRL